MSQSKLQPSIRFNTTEFARAFQEFAIAVQHTSEEIEKAFEQSIRDISAMKNHDPKKVIAFDLEVSKQFQKGQDPFALSPLGVTVAVTQEYWEEPIAWYEEDYSVCSRNTLWALLGYLSAKVKEGYKIVTWNGLGFDFRVMAEETGELEKCVEIANSVNHIDMMYHFFCMAGFPASLASVAEGMELGSKASGIDGSMIPALWKQGKYELVIYYAKRDVHLTMGIYTEININNKSKIYWETQKGHTSARNIDKWESVAANNRIILPQRAIWDRDKFLGWTTPVKAVTLRKNDTTTTGRRNT